LRTSSVIFGSLLVLFFNVVAITAGASDQAEVDQGTNAADRWLKLVDNGDYKQSWQRQLSLQERRHR